MHAWAVIHDHIIPVFKWNALITVFEREVAAEKVQSVGRRKCDISGRKHQRKATTKVCLFPFLRIIKIS